MKSAAAYALAFATTITAAQAAYDPVSEAAGLVKGADWKAMETVTVSIDENGYAPTDLRFKAGQPYRLVLKNMGDKDHYFTAPEFFMAIATRKAQVAGRAEIKAPYFTALEVMRAGGELELFFIPVVAGQYEVFCTIEDHREHGMEGSIRIE